MNFKNDNHIKLNLTILSFRLKDFFLENIRKEIKNEKKSLKGRGNEKHELKKHNSKKKTNMTKKALYFYFTLL